MLTISERSTHWRIISVLIFVCLWLPAGCSPNYYKKDADKEVYKIIDEKWKPEYGSKANYIMDDVGKDPCQANYKDLIPPSGIITLKDAVKIATKMNRTYRSQKEQLYLTVLNLTLERYRFTPRFFGLLGGEYHYLGQGNEQVTADGQLGLNYLLADGTTVSASILTDWLRYLTGDPRTSLGSVLSATIKKPLWRGSERKIIQENLTQAERDVVYQIRTFNRYRKQFVVSVISDYYHLLQSLKEVENAANDYKNRKVFEDQAIMMAETGRWIQSQVDEAKQRTLSSQVNYVRVQQNYKSKLDQFKIRTLSVPISVDIKLDPNELLALEEVGVSYPDFSIEQSIETALANRLDLANVRDEVDDARRKVAVAIDNLKGDLNFKASSRVNSRGKTDFTTLQFHQGDYTLGLDADLPLDRKSERNAYRRALISLNQSQRNMELQIDEVKLDVRQAFRNLQEAADTYRIGVQSRKLAEKRVDTNMLMLQEGRIDIEELLRAQDSLLQAKNDESQRLIDHAIARLSFLRDLGVLQVQPDGFWKEVADGVSKRQNIKKPKSDIQ